jgi:hypothetical protein
LLISGPVRGVDEPDNLATEYRMQNFRDALSPPGPARKHASIHAFATAHIAHGWPWLSGFASGAGACWPKANVICVDNYFTGCRTNIELSARKHLEALRHDVTFPL